MGKKKKKKSGNPAVAYAVPVTPPQDHLPKKDSGPVTVEVRGVEWLIDAEALDDVELFDMIERFGARKDTATALQLMPRILSAVLGEEQKAKAFDLIRDEVTGRVTFENADIFISELFGALNPN